ncbi:hypothetical protein ACIPY0_13415 [Paenarthrobacter nicotinovorans]
MEVTLTIENAEGQRDHVTGSGADYGTALAAAEALIPEGSKAIVIRTT